MAGRKSGGENTKKAAGNARKAEAAAAKQAVRDRESERMELEKWKQGAKDTSKADTAAVKSAEAARKKAEKAALLAEEEASLPSKASKTKIPTKKSRGLDLSGLDDPALLRRANVAPTLNASGIDNALDALSLDAKSTNTEAVERHPERRFKAAYAAYEERRLQEMKDDKTLRRQQKIELIRKEFEKSDLNPFNQVNARYNATKDEVREIKDGVREEIEGRLAEEDNDT